MNVIKEMLSNIETTSLQIGRVGENLHTQVRINCITIFQDYPEALVDMAVVPPVGDAYPAIVERDGVVVVWDVLSSDLAYDGRGQIQLTFRDDEEIIKTVIGSTTILPSIEPTGEAPTPIENWIDEANEILDEFGEVTNMTASAETVAAGASAEATVSKVDGHFNINFKIPRGASGNETIDDTAGIGDTDKVWSADKDAKEISALKSAKAPAITESISTPADVQTFSDGADGMLVKTLTVAIDPVQDLHGQDAPYPAGGGKNLLNPEYRNNLSNNIQFYKDAGYLIKAGVTYTLSISGNNANGLYFVLKSDDSNLTATYNNTYLTYTATEDTLVYFNIYYSPVPSGGLSSINCQLEIGSTATTWSPYSNICPITGHTGANVSRTGKNLLKLVESEMISTGWNRGFPISIKEGTYIISCQNQFGASSAFGARVSLADENNVVIKNLTSNYDFGNTEYSGSSTAITEEEANRIKRISFELRSGGTTFADIVQGNLQLEFGSTASTYEPYSGSTTEYEFPQEAGTVYGGTLTIHQDGSGELVVDHGFIDTQSNTWTINAINDHGIANFKYYKSPLEFDFNADVITSALPYDSSSQANATKPGYSISGASTLYVRLYSSEASTVAEFKQWASANGLQILLKLATPVTYQLTNQQVIELLSFNNIWADTGKINAVEYPADTKLYIDKKLTELQALVLEN